MIELIPALALLSAVLIIVLVLLHKFDPAGLTGLLQSTNLMLLSAAVLFVLVAVIYLFDPESWTRDLLKVVGGVVVGASVSPSLAFLRRDGGIDVSGGEFGPGAKFAGRDFRETIQSMYGDIHEMKDAVVNRVTAMDTALGATGLADERVTEFLFYTAFLIQGEPVAAAAGVLRELQRSGWMLISTAASYSGDDGMVLLFRRVRDPGPDDEREPETGQYRVRVYHGRNAVEVDYE